MKRAISTICALVTAAATLTASGDEFGMAPDEPEAEFHFTRLYYNGQGGFDNGSWHVDYPEAETHLTQGLTRLTRIATGDRSRIFRITDDAIFEHGILTPETQFIHKPFTQKELAARILKILTDPQSQKAAD